MDAGKGKCLKAKIWHCFSDLISFKVIDDPTDILSLKIIVKLLSSLK